MSIKNSEVRLYRNIKIREGHNLYFETESEQTAFWNSRHSTWTSLLSLFMKDNYSGGTLRISVPYDTCILCNYMQIYQPSMYKKYMYAFVSNVRYINDNTTEIEFETDFIQTYMTDVTLNPCYIERMHSVSDEKFSNNVMEGISFGSTKYIHAGDAVKNEEIYPLIPCIAIQSKSGGNWGTNIGYVDGAYSGTRLIIPNKYYDYSQNDKISDEQTLLYHFINFAYANGTKFEIINFYALPKFLYSVINKNLLSEGAEIAGVALNDLTYGNMENCFYAITDSVPNAQSDTRFFEISHLDKIGDYTPKNNKCFNDEFCEFHITNGCGQDITLDPHKIKDNTVFQLYATTQAPCKMIAVLKNYDGVPTPNWNIMISLQQLPFLSFGTSAYQQWLGNNGLAFATMGALRDTLSLGLRFGTAKTIEDTSEFFADSILSPLDIGLKIGKQINTYKSTPNNITGSDESSYPLIANKEAGLKAYWIVPEHDNIKMIDDYFTMYGYKVGAIQKPNMHLRENFTYIQTVGLCVTGVIPKLAVDEWNTQLNKGLTFWTNHSNMLDYSVSNNVLGE